MYSSLALLPLVTICKSRRIINHHICIQLIRLRERAILGELRRLLCNLGSFRIVFIEFGLRRYPVLDQFLLKDTDGIARAAPLLLLLARAVIRRVGHRMPPEAVRLYLQ